MKKEYHVVEDVFSNSTLSLLKKYCAILPTDSSSYDVWPNQITNYNQLPECFTNTLQGKDKMVVLQELFDHNLLPCAGKKWLKDADIAIQKIVPGGSIRKHRDYCRFSLTVFLSDPDGGEFTWWDHEGINHVVPPKYNAGIYANYDEFCFGAYHEVRQVIADKTRFTLQLFVFDQNNPVNAKIGEKYDDTQDEEKYKDTF